MGKRRYTFLKCLWFVAFLVRTSGIPAQPCKLDTLFTPGFSECWKTDSLGMAGQRRQFYRSVFLNERGLKKDLPIKGISPDCLCAYLGKPNKTYSNKTEQTYVYYAAISWLGADKNDYEGITVNFFIDKKTGLVTDFAVMIT